MNPAGCPGCDCDTASPVHAVVASIIEDDLDRALDLGLLGAEGCPTCSPACTSTMLGVRDERRAALAARERYRARMARLARRGVEKAAARETIARAAGRPPLPAAAASALARAMARAKGPAS